MVNLTPNDIERRTFSLEERGYNRDEVRKFLFEVAARLRLAFHTTQPPVSLKTLRPEAEPDEVAEPEATTAPETGVEPEERGTDELANPFGDPLAALAGDLDDSSDADPLDRFDRVERLERLERGERVDGPAIDRARRTQHANDRTPNPSDDGYERLGSEVADVLRAAHEIVEARRAQAELEAAAIRAEAQNDIAELRRQAQTEAAWQLDRAKRVLVAAQEQAEAIIAEAEAQAKAVITGARDQAERHSQHVAAQARQHAATILRAEREALNRLHEANVGVRAAIDFITASEARPVVDLTDFRPHVHLGEVSVEMHGDDVLPDDAAVQDPLVRMVRHAVDRAVDGAAEHANDVLDDADGADDAAAEEPQDDVVAPSSGRTLDALPDAPAAV